MRFKSPKSAALPSVCCQENTISFGIRTSETARLGLLGSAAERKLTAVLARRGSDRWIIAFELNARI